MNISDRIKQRMKDLGFKGVDITRATGVSSGGVSQWVSGMTVPKGNNLMKLSIALDCRPDWLLNGTKYPTLGLTSNVGNGPPIRQMIPVISWVQAGEFCESEVMEPYEVEEWMPCPANASLRTFGLVVKGDSMTSPHAGERSYPQGIVIFVDPEKEVVHGSRVIAIIEGSTEATFKSYTEDAGARYLKPINPQYPIREIGPDVRICGVVIGSYWPE